MGAKLKNDNLNEDFDIIIVGYGLAARCLLNELSKSNELLKKKILVIYNEEVFPACSRNTTSVVCLSGVKKGVSPLGDFIFDSYLEALEYFEKNPEVYTKGYQHLLCNQTEKGKEDFVRRFGSIESFQNFCGLDYEFMPLFGKKFDAYFINPDSLLLSLEKKYIDKLDITFKNQMALDIKECENEVTLSTDLEEFKINNLILCSGAFSKLFQDEVSHEDLIKSKFVSGSYLTFDNVDWGNESFTIALRHYNLVYRHIEKNVMLGGSTVKEDLLAPSFSELKEQLEAFQELLPKDFPFPDFKKGHVKTGMRHKGKKRTPFFGVLKETKASKVYGMTGLYKNGFSYPFLGAKKIREFLELDL